MSKDELKALPADEIMRALSVMGFTVTTRTNWFGYTAFHAFMYRSATGLGMIASSFGDAPLCPIKYPDTHSALCAMIDDWDGVWGGGVVADDDGPFSGFINGPLFPD